MQRPPALPDTHAIHTPRAGFLMAWRGVRFAVHAPLPSPLCGGGWPAKRVGRGER
ncbi:hypothetical protein WYO_5884, partial [Methylobacterium sp. GXF4]